MNTPIPFKIIWNDEQELTAAQLEHLLKIFGDLLPLPLSQRMNLKAYAEKLLNLAEIAAAYQQNEVVGLLILYANDTVNGSAHIPLVSVLPDAQGYGIGKSLISRAKAKARQKNMREIWLTVEQDNQSARRLYESQRFKIRAVKATKFEMECDLTHSDILLNPQVTPLEPGNALAAELGLDIDLRIKRDDLYPLSGGGIKARKIGFIVKDALRRGYDALVTNGGPQSNHARATAITAANLGILCHLVIVLDPGQKYLNTGNILLMRLSGAVIEYASKDQLALRMDQAVERISNQGHKPLYIWGGGHCLQGTVAFVEAAAEVRDQCGAWIPDYLVLASGTGSTQAGLAIGFSDLPTRVIGISVARDHARGSAIIRSCIEEYYKNSPGRKELPINFRDEWTDGGYEMYSPELISVIEKSARSGYFFDPTYSGKGLRGLTTLVNNHEIPPGSKVLFWHTGGLMNLNAADHFIEGTTQL